MVKFVWSQNAREMANVNHSYYYNRFESRRESKTNMTDLRETKSNESRNEDVDDTSRIAQKTPINILNADCLAKIFGYLNCAERIRVERVCRSWQDVAFHFSWEKTFTLDLEPIILGAKPVGKGHGLPEISCQIVEELLKRCGKYLKHITCYFEKSNAEDGGDTLGVIADYCRGIRSISCYTATVSGITKLASNCRNLEKFSVDVPIHDFHDTQVYDEFRMIDLALSLLFLNNKNLTKLKLESRPQLRGTCLKHLPMKMINDLCVSNFIFDFSKCYMKSLAILASEAVNLQKLDITVTFTQERKILYALSNCKNLTSITLLLNVAVDRLDQYLSRIFKSNVHLKEIDIEDTDSNFFTGESLRELKIRKIEKLHLSILECTEEQPYLSEILCGKASLSLEHMRSLAVFVASDSFSCILLKAISFCKNLKCLRLKMLTKLQENFAASISCLRDLEDLRIHGCKKDALEHSFFVKIVENLQSLRCLNLMNFECIAYSGIGLLSSLPNLNKLHLIDIPRFISCSKIVFASSLEEVQFRSCPAVSDDVIIKLLKDTHVLRSLCVFDCGYISNDSVIRAINETRNRKNGVSLLMAHDSKYVENDSLNCRSPALFLSTLEKSKLKYFSWNN